MATEHREYRVVGGASGYLRPPTSGGIYSEKVFGDDALRLAKLAAFAKGNRVEVREAKITDWEELKE